MLLKYLQLTKPGIVLGNLMTAAAGFMLASKGLFDTRLFIATMTGLSLVVASGCVLNNFLDRQADQKMKRTQARPLARGIISPLYALIFAVVLLLVGSYLLIAHTHLLTWLMAFAGFIIYVFFYSFLKYRTVYGTEIGSLAGAVPPVVGYTAVAVHLDLGALILFFTIALWQMPHFFAIALYRSKEYARASIPVLPLVKGTSVTQLRMILYTAAFILSTMLLTLTGYTGYSFLVITTLLGCIWLYLCFQGFKTPHIEKWARTVFRFSLIVVTLLCGMIALDSAI